MEAELWDKIKKASTKDLATEAVKKGWLIEVEVEKIDRPELLKIIFENRKLELGVGQVHGPSSPVGGPSEKQPVAVADWAQI